MATPGLSGRVEVSPETRPQKLSRLTCRVPPAASLSPASPGRDERSPMSHRALTTFQEGPGLCEPHGGCGVCRVSCQNPDLRRSAALGVPALSLRSGSASRRAPPKNRCSRVRITAMARHQWAPLRALPKDPKGMPSRCPPIRGSIGPLTRKPRTPSEVLGQSEAAALRCPAVSCIRREALRVRRWDGRRRSQGTRPGT